ncbi:MAG: hypothetical protein ACPGRD_11530 [Planktomarina sp.]
MRSWSEGRFERHLNNTLVQFKGNRSDLLVGFNSQFDIKKQDAVFVPWGSQYAMERDISYLGFATHMPNWYRDGWAEMRLRQLAEEGFFNQFDRILVAGHSMGGYMALVAARLIPNAKVVAFSPQTTMDQNVVEFEERFGRANRLDWSQVASDAAHVIGSLGQVTVFADPRHRDDTLHAKRLSGDAVQIMNCYGAGHSTFLYLNRMGVAQKLMDDLFEGPLDNSAFYQAYRNRRFMDWHRNSLMDWAEKTGRTAWVEGIQAAQKSLVQPDDALPLNRAGKDFL